MFGRLVSRVDGSDVCGEKRRARGGREFCAGDKGSFDLGRFVAPREFTL